VSRELRWRELTCRAHEGLDPVEDAHYDEHMAGHLISHSSSSKVESRSLSSMSCENRFLNSCIQVCW